MLGDWRQVLSNRPFLLFSLAMIGSYVLSFQVYLALPLEVARVSRTDTTATVGVGLLFAVAGLLAMVAQVPITAWCKRRWTRGQSIGRGLVLMGLAFLPLLASPATRPAGGSGDVPGELVAQAMALAPALAAAALLTIGTLIAYPFEMEAVVTLANHRLVATHYGLYNTLAGIGITAGNLLTGAALDTARAAAVPALPWLVLCVLGVTSGLAVARLVPAYVGRHRRPGRIPPPRETVEPLPRVAERHETDQDRAPSQPPAPPADAAPARAPVVRQR